MQGEGLPDNLPPGANPPPAFRDKDGLEYWHVNIRKNAFARLRVVKNRNTSQHLWIVFGFI